MLADGVAEGRRIFANTIKYVLMGTSSNFGNMFSVTVAAAFLPFLPMLPFQILLNNLLYDTSQMTIPTDRVDEEQLARPSHWDIGFIRRFMIRFGPISSVFDFATFAVMLWVFDAAAPEFRSGWFVESLATQTLIVFVIRTRRVPFFRSRPSRPLLASVHRRRDRRRLIPQSPLNDTLGFAPLPPAFFAVLVALRRRLPGLRSRSPSTSSTRSPFPRPPRPLRRGHTHRVHRLAARWSHHQSLPPVGRLGTREGPGPAARDGQTARRAEHCATTVNGSSSTQQGDSGASPRLSSTSPAQVTPSLPTPGCSSPRLPSLPWRTHSPGTDKSPCPSCSDAVVQGRVHLNVVGGQVGPDEAVEAWSEELVGGDRQRTRVPAGVVDESKLVVVDGLEDGRVL